ncbi:MAG: acetoin utilization protein AcuC, partial [Chloroflexota bacterium]|nr:acetoin utilization protein AcuC [Chloroflexota bacterium]
LLAAAGLFASGAAVVIPPHPADVADILRIHSGDYVDIVRRLSAPETARHVRAAEAGRYGFSAQGDNPPFAGMYEYYLLLCGAATDAVRLVHESPAGPRVSFMPAGGVNHHAMPARASGFGVFNDAAVAIAWLRERGQRVMYLDLDVHHGDGVEAAFFEDDQVLTVSFHESTRYLFPGPKGGAPEDIGAGNGRGYSVNVAFPPYTGDDAWLWAFEEIVPPLYHAFAPDLLLVQLGADGYHADPLAHLLLTTHAYETAARRLAHLTGRRLAALGGGGYDVLATPRIWALEFAVLAGILGEPPASGSPWEDLRDAPGSVPTPSRSVLEHVRQGAEDSVATIKRLVFPRHGLAP